MIMLSAQGAHNASRRVTSMVASGPRPPSTGLGSSGGDEPLRINIGEGMMGTSGVE